MGGFFVDGGVSLMTLQELVNSILPALGENPVSSLDSRNPTVGLILSTVEFNRRTLLARGWWFNKTHIEVIPDYHGTYIVPHGVIQWRSSGQPSVLLGNRLVNPDRGLTSDFPDVKKLVGEVVLDVPFEELPESFKELLAASTKVKVYVDDVGSGGAVEVWQQEVYRLEALLLSEHIRNIRYATRDRPAFKRINAARWR